MKKWSWLFVFLLIHGTASCGSEQPDLEQQCELQTKAWIAGPRVVDLLLVIDDSLSMAEAQSVLRDNLALFGDVLQNFGGGLPDVQIAVVSGDPTKQARFQKSQNQESCPAIDGELIVETNERWWTCGNARTQPCTSRNYQESLTEALPCLGQLGSAGSDDQQLFEMAVLALQSSDNGFLRPEAPIAMTPPAAIHLSMLVLSRH